MGPAEKQLCLAQFMLSYCGCQLLSKAIF